MDDFGDELAFNIKLANEGVELADDFERNEIIEKQKMENANLKRELMKKDQYIRTMVYPKSLFDYTGVSPEQIYQPYDNPDAYTFAGPYDREGFKAPAAPYASQTQGFRSPPAPYANQRQGYKSSPMDFTGVGLVSDNGSANVGTQISTNTQHIGSKEGFCPKCNKHHGPPVRSDESGEEGIMNTVTELLMRPRVLVFLIFILFVICIAQYFTYSAEVDKLSSMSVVKSFIDAKNAKGVDVGDKKIPANNLENTDSSAITA